MIPTSVTNSPPVSAGLAQNGAAVVGGNNGAGGAAAATAGAATTATAAAAAAQQNMYSSIVLGLASLILEGRPIADDEYQLQQQHQQQHQQQQQQQLMVGSGRLSPRPSTSRAAINITTNPYALTSGTPRTPFGPGHGSSGSHSHNSNSHSSSNSSQATHQRWTQKLCQLRQLSPAAQSMSVEPELVALAINELNAERGDFEIVRRVMLNRAGLGGGLGGGTGLGGGAATALSGGGSGGAVPAALGTATNSSSAASSPGSASENILHSLQSLATTCLRGGPVVPAETRPLSLALASTSSAASLLDYNCSRSGLGGVGGGVAIPATGLGVGHGLGASTTATATSTSTTATASSDAAGSSCAARPKHGPHCDQFLRKMGLAKGDAPDAEEHFCDMSYVNITCSRWRAHCLKMEAILARREPVCIEVYLGPAGHKILLEQWIISGKEKVPPPTMTLPSLCSAIRSQLYFSQIVAWCDLLRKCDPSVYDSGRVIFASSNANNAGDLATTTTTSTLLAGGGGGGGGVMRRPRLNIFYRIRAHDANATNGGQNDGGFSAKATVHNFPHVNIAENFSVAVCVKSLPRFNGGLPHVATPTPPPPQQQSVATSRAKPEASTPTGGGGMCAATPTGLGARIANSNAAASSCDKYATSTKQRQQQQQQQQQQQSKHLQRQREHAEFLELQLDLDLDADAAAGADELDGHRERQLQKYRKRMQRRDKKRERKPSEQQVEAMDEGSSSEVAMVMTLTAATPRRQGIAMISTGTQTSLSSCQQCGSEKTLLCLNCNCNGQHHEEGDKDDDDDDTSASEMDDMSSCSLSSSDLIVGTPRNKAELLLQAIQRTPKNRKPTAPKDLKAGRELKQPLPSSNSVQQQQQQQQQQQNNNQHKPSTAPSSGCQVCKRQKTQHNFSNGQQQSARESNGHASDSNSMEQEQQEQQSSSTKLTPNLERCSLNAPQDRCKTPPEQSVNGGGGGATAAAALEERLVVQFKTPISHVPLKQQEFLTAPLTVQPPKLPNQLRLNCSGATLLDRETPPPMLSPQLRKALPKVNLTTIFCGSGSSSSAPIAIDNSLAFCFEPSTLSQAHSQSLLTPPEAGNLPVQKSYSAPTLPNALAVSPRFAKQAAFYKRRSRHLSDRSDRSSLGSDEQLSDEDLESGMCSPAGSPLKSRARLASQFTGRPLLGNLEESLLQKRLLPKIEVAGFRLQLGASGGFCPTQLTIPASSYFYELHGETLSTPYLCEIRLPRKGYFVPRSGTVQATLLNPMGTVVRMFVIPYDMHDMPPLHRTFIRQRILAEELLPDIDACTAAASLNPLPQRTRKEREREPGSPTAATSTTGKLGHFISAEQMKRLRYSIHLRFQTSRSGRLSLHTDIRLLISRRTDCDTAAAHAKGLLEAPNELVTDTLMPTEPRYSARQESPGKI
ncbi:protein Atossa [Drosophila sulfurigaster albostrigata]|uniref:protein Atossa n=1 Tax=Drosophila sulfurigaster albostrigata TaxID=89887 RepID=UPI002D21C352|nr:protein Atossa [Drosophila sulfurigaster albostrigata]XP_062127462.1 protein Atossa [Drosophila sulfurigaster albostrigata]